MSRKLAGRARVRAEVARQAWLIRAHGPSGILARRINRDEADVGGEGALRPLVQRGVSLVVVLVVCRAFM